ncbi:MAG: trigger factor family protein, partial [Ignavibacteria bacterium]|nr:trigger factor family protein [Ignavibacteria bacterium]
MEKKITQLEGCEKKIEITLSKSEIQPFIEKAYAEAAPKVDLKGFRKGKVPRHVVKQFFGKQLEFDAKQDASNDYFQKIVKEENIKIVSQPGLTDIKEDENGATFTVVFESFPEFELGEYRGLNIDEPIHRATDEEIEHEILHLSINAGEINEAEEVKNDMYIVKYNYRKIDDATNLPLIGESENDAQLFLHNHDIYPALRDRFMNLKVGDSFNYLPAPNDKFPVNEMVMITITEIKEVV